jgi:hypothetical protein
MKSNCPFCGVPADAPHETQEGCIAALNVEIARMRRLIRHVQPLDGDTVEVLGTPELEGEQAVWPEGV